MTTVPAVDPISPETYTLGYSDAAMRFVSRRSFESHAAFFAPFLRPDAVVLDCGCGPGSITLGLARHVSDGRVTGIDMDPGQIETAGRRARGERVANALFMTGSVYALPYADAAFDAVFSHALFEHLAHPVDAARECLRVLKPDGVMGVVTPDWEAFVVAPDSPEVRSALADYCRRQADNGGDPGVGRKLATILTEAGFTNARMAARFENFDPLSDICEVMAVMFDRDGMPSHARTMKELQDDPRGMWAEAWISCVAKKPIDLA